MFLRQNKRHIKRETVSIEQMLIDIFCDIDDFCNIFKEYCQKTSCNGLQKDNPKMQNVLIRNYDHCGVLSFVKPKDIQMVLQKPGLRVLEGLFS